MAKWTIDAKLRRATRGADTVDLIYIDKEWTATPSSEPPVSKSERNSVLSAWKDKLDIGVSLLVAAGNAMFGENWILPMADALAIGRESIRRWTIKERPLTVEHPVWDSIETALIDRRTVLEKQIKEIDTTLKDIQRARKGSETFESGRYAGGQSA